jgi:hypothetical protein
MLRLYELVAPVVFVLWVFCIIDAITSPEASVRNLPKIAWVLLVLFFPFVGSIAWLAAGRPTREPVRRSAYEREAPAFPEYDRPGRMAASSPEDDEAFLRRVRERAEEQRRKAAEDRRRREGEDGATA